MNGAYTLTSLARDLGTTPRILNRVLTYADGKRCVRVQEPLGRYVPEEDRRWFVDRDFQLQVYNASRYGDDLLRMVENDAWGFSARD
jgi:hypothetical protein